MTEESFQTNEDQSGSSVAAEYEFFSANEFSIDEVLALRSQVHGSSQEKSRFARLVEELPDPAATQSPEKVLRKGVGHWILGQYPQAIECLKRLKNQPVAVYFWSRSLLSRGQAKEAQGLLEDLAKEKNASAEVQGSWLSSYEALEDWDGLRKALKSTKSIHDTAEAHYFEGRLAEVDRQPEKAIASYEKALESKPEYRNALFRLAYQLDLRGLDDEAIALYEKLTHLPPVDTRALMNLGVLYEDRSQYDRAIACFQAAVHANPTDSRARMYLKDAKSSTNMYYDEDLEKKEDKMQQILRIPITDFELSVRARNCLAKMEIQSLGDLVKKSEPELLSFKNFGETSLNEIKEILRSKGLRLGMTKDDGMIDVSAVKPANYPAEVSPEVLQKSVSELDLSVRSRRMVDTLGLRTLGELSAKSERDLLNTPNFGQTSLNEIKEKLRLFGLKLGE